MDLLRPNTAGGVEERQQKQQHDSRAKVRVFKAGETVLVKNYGSGCRWLPARIMEASDPVSFRVRLEDGRLRRCHQDQIRPRLVENETSEMSQTAVDDTPSTSSGTSEEAVPATEELAQDLPGTDSRVQPSEALQTTSSSISTSESNEPRYPRRD